LLDKNARAYYCHIPTGWLAAWLFYFGVQSITAAKTAIEMGGGSVVNGPHQVPGGDWVVIAVDPQGAAFGVVGPQGAHA
jgi:predicted enzyme related to lactoylglutathione lyase